MFLTLLLQRSLGDQVQRVIVVGVAERKLAKKDVLAHDSPAYSVSLPHELWKNFQAQRLDCRIHCSLDPYRLAATAGYFVPNQEETETILPHLSPRVLPMVRSPFRYRRGASLRGRYGTARDQRPGRAVSEEHPLSLVADAPMLPHIPLRAP